VHGARDHVPRFVRDRAGEYITGTRGIGRTVARAATAASAAGRRSIVSARRVAAAIISRTHDAR
jgi:hypothetical protein